jgi:hypothetical protein
MTKQIIILSLVVIFGSSGCDVVQTHKFRSYITGYSDYQRFDLQLSDGNNIAIVGSEGVWLCEWDSKDAKKKMYDSLCVLHNDMSYNKKRDYIAGPNWGVNYKGDFTSIDMVSNADFDEQHPANSSLNDIVRFMSISLYPYILSGYKDTFDWERNLPENFKCEKRLSEQANNHEASCYHPVDKRLSEIILSDLVLVDLMSFYKTGALIGFLVFEKQPTIAKEHELTVTIKVSDGRVFTPSITKVFE